MEKKKDKPIIDIEEIIKNNPWTTSEGYYKTGIELSIKEALSKALDYTMKKVAEELEVDYIDLVNPQNSQVEVFIKYGSIDELKESIKQDLGI